MKTGHSFVTILEPYSLANIATIKATLEADGVHHFIQVETVQFV